MPTVGAAFSAPWTKGTVPVPELATLVQWTRDTVGALRDTMEKGDYSGDKADHLRQQAESLNTAWAKVAPQFPATPRPTERDAGYDVADILAYHRATEVTYWSYPQADTVSSAAKNLREAAARLPSIVNDILKQNVPLEKYTVPFMDTRSRPVQTPSTRNFRIFKWHGVRTTWQYYNVPIRLNATRDVRSLLDTMNAAPGRLLIAGTTINEEGVRAAGETRVY